jgi:hypothetical protein
LTYALEQSGKVDEETMKKIKTRISYAWIRAVDVRNIVDEFNLNLCLSNLAPT